MSVRHVHASPGEYIAVHRNGPRQGRSSRSGGGGGSADGEGIGCLILLGAAIMIYYWEVILAIAVIAGAGFLIWKFHTQIGHFLKGFGLVLVTAFGKIFKGIVKLGSNLKNKPSNGNPGQGSSSVGAGSQNCGSADYGKIRQHRN